MYWFRTLSWTELALCLLLSAGWWMCVPASRNRNKFLLPNDS